jgi:hypothetical protein
MTLTRLAVGAHLQILSTASSVAWLGHTAVSHNQFPLYVITHYTQISQDRLQENCV